MRDENADVLTLRRSAKGSMVFVTIRKSLDRRVERVVPVTLRGRYRRRMRIEHALLTFLDALDGASGAGGTGPHARAPAGGPTRRAGTGDQGAEAGADVVELSA